MLYCLSFEKYVKTPSINTRQQTRSTLLNFADFAVPQNGLYL